VELGLYIREEHWLRVFEDTVLGWFGPEEGGPNRGLERCATNSSMISAAHHMECNVMQQPKSGAGPHTHPHTHTHTR